MKYKPTIKFPKKLCIAIAGITQEFSFAYLKEAFVATLLTIANRRTERGGGDDGDDGGNDDLDDYELWVEMKKTVKALREDMGARRKRTAFGHVLEAAPAAPQVMSALPPVPAIENCPMAAKGMVQHDLAIRGCEGSLPTVSYDHPHTESSSGNAWHDLPLITDGGEVVSQRNGYPNIPPSRV